MEHLRIDNYHNIDIINNTGLYILTNKSILFCEYEKLSNYTKVCDLDSNEVLLTKSFRELKKVFFVTKKNTIKTFTPGNSTLEDVKIGHKKFIKACPILDLYFNNKLQFSTKNRLFISNQLVLSFSSNEKVCNVINDLILVFNSETFRIILISKIQKDIKQIQQCDSIYKINFNSNIQKVESKLNENILKFIVVLENGKVHYSEFNVVSNEIIFQESTKWFGSKTLCHVSFSHVTDKVYFGGKEGVLMIWDVHSGFKQVIPRFGAKITGIIETLYLDLVIIMETGVIYYLRALDNETVDSLTFAGYYKEQNNTKTFPSTSENTIGGELINGLYQIYNFDSNKEIHLIDFQQNNENYYKYEKSSKKSKREMVSYIPMQEPTELVDVLHVRKKLFYAFYNIKKHESNVPIVRILGCDNGTLVFKEDIKMKNLIKVTYDTNKSLFELSFNKLVVFKQKEILNLSIETRTYNLNGYSLELYNIEEIKTEKEKPL